MVVPIKLPKRTCFNELVLVGLELFFICMSCYFYKMMLIFEIIKDFIPIFW